MDQEWINKMQETIPLVLFQVSETLKQYTISATQFQEYHDRIRPVIVNITTISSIHKTAEKLENHQFVLTDRLPKMMLDRDDDINSMANEFLISDELVEKTLSMCLLTENRVFYQAIDFMRTGLYDIAILGLTAVLDMVLSEYSGQIKNVKIKSRCETIKNKVEEKGDLYLDEMEEIDFLLFITYPKAVGLFGADSDFTSKGPEIINRHGVQKRIVNGIPCQKGTGCSFLCDGG